MGLDCCATPGSQSAPRQRHRAVWVVVRCPGPVRALQCDARGGSNCPCMHSRTNATGSSTAVLSIPRLAPPCTETCSEGPAQPTNKACNCSSVNLRPRGARKLPSALLHMNGASACIPSPCGPAGAAVSAAVESGPCACPARAVMSAASPLGLRPIGNLRWLQEGDVPVVCGLTPSRAAFLHVDPDPADVLKPRQVGGSWLQKAALLQRPHRATSDRATA